MFDEQSAGAVIYYIRERWPRYLILQYPQGHWDFPRGHIEQGEGEVAAAKREIREETGLAELDFDDTFRVPYSWKYRRLGKLSHKQAVYFIARAKSDSISLSDEHRDYCWLEYEQARQRLTFPNVRLILDKAHQHIAA